MNGSTVFRHEKVDAASPMTPPVSSNGESMVMASSAVGNQRGDEREDQQQGGIPKTPPRRKDLTPKQLAIQEAQMVMAACEQMPSSHVHEFNLLGVVANPRDSSHGPSAYRSSLLHHQAQQPMVGIGSNPPPHAATSTSSSMGTMTETLHSLEVSVAQITEQIDALNVVFDSWSRQYLGATPFEDVGAVADTSGGLLAYVPDDSILASQLTELPPELENLDLSLVQRYMDQSGMLAGQFTTRAKAAAAEDQHRWHENISTDSDITETLVKHHEAQDVGTMARLEREIPNQFFQTYFDLTNEQTFRELLVEDKEPSVQQQVNQQQQKSQSSSGRPPLSPPRQPPAAKETKNESTETTSDPLPDDLPDCLKVPTSSILPLPSPDAFTANLDAVEVALLHQVRSKSIAFFHETNRFGQLKEWIAGLVEEVQRVRTLLGEVQSKSVVAWELIPLLDQQRNDLLTVSEVLDAASEVLQAKQSISGLLSANDDLNAAKHIQYGRKLLAGPNAVSQSGRAASLSTISEADVEEEISVSQYDLTHLQALSTVGAQLAQYESLVVANLGEELVETFLAWNKNSDTERALELMDGLALCGATSKVQRLYVNRLLDVMRVTTRTTVGEFADEARDSSVKTCVTSMTLERFMDCLTLLLEQLLECILSAVAVQDLCTESAANIDANGNDSAAVKPKPSPFGRGRDGVPSEAVQASAELSSKSIAELLRLRKEAHSLVSLEEMVNLWNLCLNFLAKLEKTSPGFKAAGLRTTLLAQAKNFVERKHESNMSALAAALDSERWTQCDISAGRQAQLTRLCSGRAAMATKGSALSLQDGNSNDRSSEADVEGVQYKVVWSCLLLVEMVMTNIECAAQFQSLAANVVGKVAELLRLFNSRSTQLVLGAGAIHSAARLKSINAKHLSLVTQCLGMTIAILPHVRAALMAQLPTKQHNLLVDLDTIKKEYGEHNEKVLNKFVSIVGGIVEHGLAPRIGGTNFDNRAKKDPDATSSPVKCCVFLDGVSTNTRKMHHVLNSLLPRDHLQDVFSRILAFVDQKIPALFEVASKPPSSKEKRQRFVYPSTDEGKRRMLLEVETMTNALNQLDRVRPWEFTAISVLERKMDYWLYQPEPEEEQENGDEEERAPTEEGGNHEQDEESRPLSSPEEDDTSSEQTANAMPDKEQIQDDDTSGEKEGENVTKAEDRAENGDNGSAEAEGQPETNTEPSPEKAVPVEQGMQEESREEEQS